MAVIERLVVRSISDDPESALKECEQCVRIQKEVGWGGEGVSSHILRADSIGLLTDIVDLGYVLVAENVSSGEIVGFARVTYTSDPGTHWLHEVAVLPLHQGYGVGYKIMMEVRSRSRAGGASYLFFTYDPLDARNGNLYLTKCGGRGVRVFRNLYGFKAEGSSRNRLSHRLLVRWDLEAQAVLPESRVTAGMRSVRSLGEIPNGEPFILEVPSVLSAANEEKLLEWQEVIFPVLYESVNGKGYEAQYVAPGKGNEPARLVLVPRSREETTHS
jgi:predicted GNAT superfamily acetyltransferase